MARGEDVKTVVATAAMIDPPAVRSVVRVKIAQIDASERLREISEAHAQVIAASMLEHEERGGRRQLQAVELVQRGDGYRLVFGAHRLRAHQINGWDEIDAEIVTATDAELRLREIDENLIRHELTALDRARFLLERKRLYEAMNPAAKHGVNRFTRDANVATLSFAADIAEKTGFSERTVQRACEIAANLAPAAIDRLRDTPMASNQKALEALSKQPHERQLAALDHLFAAENPAPSVNAAFDRLDGKAVKPAAELKVSKVIDQLGRLGAREWDEVLAHMSKADRSRRFQIVEKAK